ncbi:hypothetical protein AAMO2058_001286800 [Amorphochlora amoebiformis]|uniref:Uncharacterized protein n=1 Tax=Amorphochlora amoebiformis TaxID=1561963 RepID=A0A7S0DQM9_9EUKA|mmetsp:Transcript_4898/g.7464  ORF Transcript_4898/g.7464 Transcript_4898/m.7464 type:complete len:210 (+) Transcript_4898:81-710(+)
MCLIPISGFNDMPTLIPTPRAKKFGHAMLLVLVFHVVLAILEFSALSIIDGMFDLIGAVIGYCAIRDPNRYNVYQVLCYSIYTGMDFFWGSVRIILLATKATKVPGNTEWQYKLYVITVVAGTVFYLIACIVSNFLYRELRRILRELSEPHAWAPVEGSQGNDLNNQNPQEVGSVRYDSIGPEGDRFPGTAYKIGGQQSEKSRLVSESE